MLSPRIDAAQLAALAYRIERSLAEPHLIHGRAVPVPGSIGTHLATAGDHTGDALAIADAAMYVAKRARSYSRHPSTR